ncbi:MAG: SUMF1/EgtB/PvdO family nonheme iron enzyme [Planctomycetaceae bacterium]|nr:SUMF1/EgtB/PvdO family nonheme iron enzyme [Planctomycetaceae bacterium]
MSPEPHSTSGKMDVPFSLDDVRSLWASVPGPMLDVDASIKMEPDAVDQEKTNQVTKTISGVHGSFHVEVGTSSVTLRSTSMGSGKVRESAVIDYELGGDLGRGGMGMVVAARQSSLDRRVAVKMILPATEEDVKARDKFLQEALTTGALEHPNVVPVYELGVNHQGKLFYAMKEVKGRSWRSAMSGLSQKENIDILIQIANAVDSAHAKNILHRDIKSANVMLGDYGEVLLMDWGLAVGITPGAKAVPLQQGNALAGTPAYMAPEMARGLADRIGPWSDQYLLGAVLFEILAAHPPHAGRDVNECLQNAANNIFTPHECGNEYMDVALRAMNTDPVRRYPSVKTFIKVLRQCQIHGESLELSNRAGEWAATARQDGDYDLFSRALLAYEQALELWQGNTVARTEGASLRIEYAAAAIDRHDYELALSLLAKTGEDEGAALTRKATKARHEQIRRRRMVRILAVAAVLLLAAVAVVAGGAAVIVSRQARAERLAREAAELERSRAETAEAEAVAERNRAEDALNEVEVQRSQAVTARDEAKRQQLLAEQQRNLAEESRREAEAQQAIAVEQRNRAEAARRSEAAALDMQLREQEAKLRAETEARRAAEEALAARRVVQRMGYLEDNSRWRMDPEAAAQNQVDAARRHGVDPAITVALLDGTHLSFSWIPAGTFVMGSPPRDPERSSEEHLHEVTLSSPYYMAVTELTRRQWQALVGVEMQESLDLRQEEEPAAAWRFLPVPEAEGMLPATGISHREITMLLMPRLSERLPDGMAVRLPTEAEWEWAARAGNTDAYPGGSGEPLLKRIGWFIGNSESRLRPVGLMPPNSWGLFDVCGNAAEMVRDAYDPGYYLAAEPEDPVCGIGEPMRVSRGGSYLSSARNCRLASRSYVHQENRHRQVGVRLTVRLVDKAE